MSARSVAAAGLVLALAGCSSSGGEDDRGPDLPSEAELTTYFEAVASYDPDQLAAAADVAADGSPAAAYLSYLAEYAASALAAGRPIAPTESEAVGGGFEACGGTGGPDDCVTWSDLQSEDGALSTFTVDEVPLGDSLRDLGDQAPVAADGLYSVQPGHAYLSPRSGTLFVTVTLAAGDLDVSPAAGVYIEQDRIVRGVATDAPATVLAGQSSPVVLAFPDAGESALDGQVTFDLGLGGQGQESIGFGLADPAAAG